MYIRSNQRALNYNSITKGCSESNVFLFFIKTSTEKDIDTIWIEQVLVRKHDFSKLVIHLRWK